VLTIEYVIEEKSKFKFIREMASSVASSGEWGSANQGHLLEEENMIKIGLQVR